MSTLSKSFNEKLLNADAWEQPYCYDIPREWIVQTTAPHYDKFNIPVKIPSKKVKSEDETENDTVFEDHLADELEDEEDRALVEKETMMFLGYIFKMEKTKLTSVVL